jgi:opacity protein-like surface antigen
MTTKIFPVVAIAMIMSLQAYSQFNVGVKAGVNYVNVAVPDGFSDNEYRFGYHFGGYARFSFNERISLTGELLYSNKGYKFNEDIANGSGSLHLNYINLPILFGFKPVNKLTILAGPEFGYRLSAKSKFDSQTVDVSDIWDNKFDFGIAGGINYAITDKIGVELRYVHGLTSIMKDAYLRDDMNNPIGGNLDLLNRAFQISALYTIK